ncbi:MAG: hypothetical protein IKR47_02130 [Lachnospiraceae bacterium]|nr:hypothetical protein [Lachnospiraceae bacterium]
MRTHGTDKVNMVLKCTVVLLCTVLLCAFCGCGMFASLDLTEEQSGLIAEYAAGLLKKYDRNGIRLMNPDAIREPEEEAAPQEVTPTPEVQEEAPEEPEGTPADELSFEDLSEMEGNDSGMDEPDAEEQTFSTKAIGDCLNLQGVDVVYKDFELCDIYPEHPDNSWLISMAAREGKKLTVLRFSLENNSDVDVLCDILNAGKQYRLVVNHEKRINETVTVLMDSFSQFNATIPAGAAEDVVLIFEMDNDLADSIRSLDLVIKDNLGTDTFRLF